MAIAYLPVHARRLGSSVLQLLRYLYVWPGSGGGTGAKEFFRALFHEWNPRRPCSSTGWLSRWRPVRGSSRWGLRRSVRLNGCVCRALSRTSPVPLCAYPASGKVPPGVERYRGALGTALRGQKYFRDKSGGCCSSRGHDYRSHLYPLRDPLELAEPETR